MTLFVHKNAPLPLQTHYIVFDIEAVGPVHSPKQCKIWNFAAKNLVAGQLYWYNAK